jgi:hypothetical protein
MSVTGQQTCNEYRLKSSRTELEHLMNQGSNVDKDDKETERNVFPRSKVLRILMKNRFAVVVAVAAGGLLIMQPTLLSRGLKLVPINALAKVAIAKFFARHVG